MTDDVVSGQRYSDSGVIGRVLAGAARLYPAPAFSAAALLVAGAVLGAIGDGLLRDPNGPVNLNLSLCVAAVAVAAVALHRRAALPLDPERVAWLLVGVLFAAGLAWRDAAPVKLLALGCATLSFALAAHRRAASWVRRSGAVRYAVALALGALLAWTAAALALVDAARSTPGVESGPVPSGVEGRAAGWRRAAAIVRGLAIAAPLLVVFGALFMSADAVFAGLVSSVIRVDFGRIAGHIVLFSICAWLSTGYLRGFLTGTEPVPLVDGGRGTAGPGVAAPKRLALGTTEAATALGAIDLLFLVFVIVQFRYLFGGGALVQVTPGLTYAEYARRGFFELVAATVLVVPVLLAADWLVDRRVRRDVVVFRGLAGLQIGLILAIAGSALQRLRLYHASYGLTESRFYAMALLIWIGAVLLWLAATVLRGRRASFAFGALTSGLAMVALLLVVNPDAIVARTNVARIAPAGAPVRFDAAYAASQSADAVPVLIEALPALPREMQCPIARRMLRRWPPERERSIRGWNWSVERARDAVRAHAAELRLMVGPNQRCEPIEVDRRGN
jgi:hypothetical protein